MKDLPRCAKLLHGDPKRRTPFFGGYAQCYRHPSGPLIAKGLELRDRERTNYNGVGEFGVCRS